MPQLDVVTFINQYVWIIGSITLLLILFVISILPNIKRLFEIRVNISDEDVSFLKHKNYLAFKKLVIYN